MADRIRQRITIEEVDNGEFKVISQGRDPRKNKERTAKNAEDAKMVASELLDLTFSEPNPAKSEAPAEPASAAAKKKQ